MDVMMMLCRRKEYCVPLHVRQLVCSDRDWAAHSSAVLLAWNSALDTGVSERTQFSSHG
jgi:hypothetical protein